MSLKLYNTATRRKETFLPLRKGEVSLYACGVTVYDLCHVGHARSAIVFDVLVRYLRARGFQVTYVRNFTDVDDKIIDRANLVGKDPKDLAQENIDAFYEDMGKLGVLIPDAEPRATEFIPHMVEMIRVLTDRGYAYEVDGDVFFAVDKFESYGKLSGRRLEDMKAGSRVAVDEKKRRPMDFALWKRAKPGEPNWPSPWGPGRPGWHIECSVMSSFFLGPTFDIHGGGEDLLFPHHENERAQSVAATGGEFARYWVHNGFVTVESEKMSKSLGNFLTIRDALALYHPEVLRLFLLSKHYRSPLDFAKSAVLDLQAGLVRIYRTLQRVRNIVGKEGEKGAFPLQGSLSDPGDDTFLGRFVEVMNDDLNTPNAIALIFEKITEVNKAMDAGLGADGVNRLEKDLDQILRAAGILGILEDDPEVFFEKIATPPVKMDAAKIEALIEERANARGARDFAKADEIRSLLKEKGIVLEDGPRGTTWRYDI
ncbi:MAG: cysteine--tRNA ligase [Desulfatiglandales bacterium]